MFNFFLNCGGYIITIPPPKKISFLIFLPVRDRRDEVHEDVGGYGLEVEEDAVEEAAPEVGLAEGGAERGEVNQEKHGRDLERKKIHKRSLREIRVSLSYLND